MGSVCVHQNQQLQLITSINTMILETIKQQSNRLKQDHQWAEDIFRKYRSLKSKSLFSLGYYQNMEEFRKLRPSEFEAQEPQGKELGNNCNITSDLLKNSCIVVQDQLNNTADRSNDLLVPPKPQPLQDLSFTQQANRNPSMMMQMSVIYKSQFPQQKKFNDSRKRFFKWQQMALEHLDEGFLMPLYRVFAYGFGKELEEAVKGNNEKFREGMVGSVTDFVNMMIVLYNRVYGLEGVRKQENGEMFRHDNLFNFTMTNLFRKTNIGKVLTSAVRKKYNSDIQQISQKMQLLSDKPPTYFQISPQFIPKLPPPADTSSSSSSLTSSTSPAPPPAPTKIYHPVTHNLLQIPKDPTPIGKVKCINLASKTIVCCLNKYYERIGQEAPYLDPDNVTSIMMYALVQTNQADLLVDLFIAENFTSTNCMNCISGYYINIVKACLEMIRCAEV